MWFLIMKTEKQRLFVEKFLVKFLGKEILNLIGNIPGKG